MKKQDMLGWQLDAVCGWALGWGGSKREQGDRGVSGRAGK